MAASSSTPKSSEQPLQLILEKLTEHDDFFYTLSDKISVIEQRQSHKSGLENDTTRAMYQCTAAESVALPDEVLEKRIKTVKVGQTLSYYEAFYDKDIRRCEWEAFKLYASIFKETSYYHSQDQNSIGAGAE